jgi:hypothetical protein
VQHQSQFGRGRTRRLRPTGRGAAEAAISTAGLALSAVIASAGLAHATGSFACSAEDKFLTFSAEGVFSHGLGARISNFTAAVDVAAKAAPTGFRKVTFDASHLVHSWLQRRELKLLVYRDQEEGEPPGYVELTLETSRSPKDETDYRGRYELTIYHLPAEKAGEGKTTKARGRISCSVG